MAVSSNSSRKLNDQRRQCAFMMAIAPRAKVDVPVGLGTLRASHRHCRQRHTVWIKALEASYDWSETISAGQILSPSWLGPATSPASEPSPLQPIRDGLGDPRFGGHRHFQARRHHSLAGVHCVFGQIQVTARAASKQAENGKLNTQSSFHAPAIEGLDRSDVVLQRHAHIDIRPMFLDVFSENPKQVRRMALADNKIGKLSESVCEFRF